MPHRVRSKVVKTLGLMLTGIVLAAASQQTVVRDENAVLKASWLVPPDRAGRGRAVFEEEANSSNYAREIDGRSIAGSAQLDCPARYFRLHRLTVYSLAKQAGDIVLQIDEQPDWRSADPETTMARVIRALCGPGKTAQTPAAPIQTTFDDQSSPDTHRTAMADDSPQLGEPLLAPSYSPSAAISGSSQSGTLRQTSPSMANSPTVGHPPQTPGATGLVVTWPTDQAPLLNAPVAATRGVASASLAFTQAAPETDRAHAQPAASRLPGPDGRQTPSPNSSPQPGLAARRTGYFVQLAAMTSPARADQAWRQIRAAQPRLLASVTKKVELATVDGNSIYRVLAGAFAGPEAAQAFCRSLIRPAAICVVRKETGR